MPPISVPLTLFLLPLASLLVPSTTASPLPFAKSIPEARACLTFDLPLNATNLKLGDGATCVLFSAPACAGPRAIVSSSTAPNLADPEIASLLCDLAEAFTTTEQTKANPTEEASGRRDFRNDLRRSASIMNRRSSKKREDSPPQPYAQSIQAGTGDAKLTPWKPPASSGPPKESDWCGGDGPYYANGNGCIGPGRKARDAGGLNG